MRVLLAVLLAAVMVAAPVSAVTLTTPDGSPAGPPWQEWADASRAPSPPGDITFRAGMDGSPCPPAANGCAQWWDDGRNEIWVELGPTARHVEMHELGHIFDGRVMTDAARSAWKVAIMDWRSGWWNGGDEPSGERFAEGYAFCATVGAHISEPVRGVYGYEAGPARQRRACRVLRQAAAGVYG